MAWQGPLTKEGLPLGGHTKHTSPCFQAHLTLCLKAPTWVVDAARVHWARA